jgi:type I restriction enzyme S subunit
MAYLFQTEQFLKYKKKAATGTKVVRVSGENMAKFEFAIPSLEVQERIVSILDRFDKLCHDIREGLPAEIDLRQKQYEHYRDKLLTFEAKG